jgi:ribonuclease HI
VKQIELFVDGACRGNPGPGGWGAVVRCNSHEKTLKGSEPHTTNNRMELMAAIMGLASITEPCTVIITTDSQYVQRGMTEWLPSWIRRNWQTANRQPVKNVDLWQRLAAEVGRHQVEWRWVKGHSGHVDNEWADTLANEAIDQLLRKG